MGRVCVGCALLVLTATLLPPGVAGASHFPPEIRYASGPLTAVVRTDPFGLSIEQDGEPVMKDGPATLAFALGAQGAVQPPEISYGVFASATAPWLSATRVIDIDGGVLLVGTQDPARTFRVRIAPSADGVLSVQAALDEPAGVAATAWSFVRPPTEHFLGFGERSDGADQTGRVVETWSEEGPFSAGGLKPYTDPTFGDRWQGPQPFAGTNFPMPWFVSSRGYGFLADHSAPVTFHLDGDGEWDVVAPEPALRFRVFAGPAPRQVLERFTSATGRQPEPSPWIFGTWYQPGQGAPSAQQWRDLDVPLTVAQTYAHYLPCGSQSDPALAAGYHALGYKVTTYVNSFVCSDHPGGAYAEGDAKGYFVKTAAGTTYPVPYVAYYRSPWHGVVDFTNPDAASFWQGLIDDALDDGFDGWMEDFGEYVPPDAVMHDGRSGFDVHNEYCTLYHRASDELTRARRGDDFAQFVRCGYTGTAPFARVVWGGDPTEDWSKADGLAAAISQGTSMGMSGIGYWGSDIGGFHSIFTSERTDSELLVRWLQFGSLSGVMRTEADGYARPGQGRRAQVWDDEVQPVWRKFAKLRTQLHRYVWDAAQEYRRTGMPIMRHLALEFPGDRGVWEPGAEYEYMFGPSLLVAPVIEPGATTRTLYLPPGDWVSFWDATTYDETTGAFDARAGAPVLQGARTVTVDAPLDRIPILVKASTCLTLLPASVDTLAEIGEAPGLVHPSDVVGAERKIGFAAGC